MVIILIIAILLLIGIVVAFALGIPQTGKDEGRTGVQGDRPGAEADGTYPENLVDMDSYYAESSGDEEQEQATPAPSEPRESGGPYKHPLEEAQEEKFDKLCNLKVGCGFLMDCQNILLSMRDSGQAYAVIYFDFNRFRFFNTLKGYFTGDYALTRISQEAQAILPDGALLTRISADHFVALFAYIDETHLQEMFDQLKRASDRIRVDIGAKSGLQICMGVAVTGESNSSYDIFKLIRKANIARYCLKSSRPDEYSLFNDAMVTSYLYGESALDNYKEHQYGDDFILYMRPQLLLSSKRVAGCDSRARWACEENSGNPLTGDVGVMPTGNLRTAYHVCRAMNRWRKSDISAISAMVTLSELDILKEDIDAFFARCLSEFQFDANLLTVCISLHTVRLAPETVGAQIKRLRDLGIKVAVCDIDCGMEELGTLKGMRLDYLKLHSNFARGVDAQPQRQEQVNKIIALAAELGAGTVFEGADTAGSISWLAQAGATLAQGKYVGRENVPDEFIIDVKSLIHTNSRDPNATVVLDDSDLQRGNYRIF